MAQATYIGPVTLTVRYDQTAADLNWHNVDSSGGGGTDMVLSNASFTAGNDYLIVVCANYRYGTTGSAEIRVVHGSTPTVFAGSEDSMEHSSAAIRNKYFYYTVWTAVSTEDVRLQIRKKDQTGSTAYCDASQMYAIDLDASGLTENTDWFFSENQTSNALDVADDWTHTNDQSVTFTPASAQDYLVMVQAQHDNPAAVGSGVRITRSGEASSSTANTMRDAGDTTNDLFKDTKIQVYSLGAAENTFTQESAADASSSTWTREYSSVFALRLSAFEENWQNYNAGPTSLSTTDYATQAATVSPNPSTTPTALVSFTNYLYSVNGSNDDGKARVQVDGVTVPDSSWDTVWYRTQANSDYPPWSHSYMNTGVSASTTYDLDASSSDTGDNYVEAQICVISLELAAAGGPTPDIDRGTMRGVGRGVMRGV